MQGWTLLEEEGIYQNFAIRYYVIDVYRTYTQ